MHSFRRLAISSAITAVTASMSTAAFAQETAIEEIFVLSQSTTFANNDVTSSMKDQQNAITSVLAVIDNIPGVLINEGDVFGSDDWSTTVSIRGFQLSLDEQQIGMTVDGIPNGNSNYGGGSKSNRFIDTENLETVNVSQGTADISSRSHEALGGTLDFVTQNPIDQARTRLSITLGDYNAKKYYYRYDTGTILKDTTRAYFTYSDSDVNSWIDQSGEATRNHVAVKSISELNWSNVTFYAAYDDTAEDNYQRVTAAEFKANPDWDRLTGDWTGIPYIDQLYRRGWSTLRENLLTYVKFEFQPAATIGLQITPYYHQNEGRGDWLPPYIVDITDDGAGNPHSELTSSNTVYGGSPVGQIGYVARDFSSLIPNTDCASLTFPYGGTGAGSTHLDPACFDRDAVPVGSFRHTHYEKARLGLSGDMDWTIDFEQASNQLRAGFWYEDQTREESRDWHRVIDSRTSYHFDKTPYWVQYDREYPQNTTMLYLEDSLAWGALTLRTGAKQWYVDIERVDKFAGDAGAAKLSSDSDLLPSAGILWKATDTFELFANYARNFAAIKDVVIEAADVINNPTALNNIEAETADNTDIGLRYIEDSFQATATYYQIEFDNRITYFAQGGDQAPDFLNELDGEYRNVGGIESDGFELTGTWFATENFSIYASYTVNDSQYIGLEGINGVNSTAELIAYEESIGIYRGNTVFGSVEDMYALSFDWSSEHKRAGITSKHVGKRWLDAANDYRVDAYDVADMYFAIVGDSLAGEITGYELKFTVNNVFNEKYIGGVAGGWGGWLGGARTAAINLKLDLQ